MFYKHINNVIICLECICEIHNTEKTFNKITFYMFTACDFSYSFLLLL